MKPSQALFAEPLMLRGSPRERGRLQAALRPELAGEVRHAVESRLAETAPALGWPTVRRFIDGQRAFTERHYPEILAEIDGIAEGFGLSAARLFDYLHCSTALDLTALPEQRPDGCTSFAAAAFAGGAVLAKNRDYRREHIAIQQVMRHADPAWNGREILVLGSLGSPGNFSSGLNSDGLALSDTASRTTDLGVGFHRYFLMTWLLVNCDSVDSALAAIRRITHTGSGLLVLADRTGAVAAVELGHRRVGIEQRPAGRVGRVNHFVLPDMAPANMEAGASAASRANSERRWPCLQRRLAALPDLCGPDDIAAVLSYHGEDGGEAFCRHEGADLSLTIAATIFLTRTRQLFAAFGNPCAATWQRFDLSPAVSVSAAQ